MSHEHDDEYDQPIEKHTPAEGFDRSDPQVAKIFAFTITSLLVLGLVIVAIQQYFETIYAQAVYDKILSAPSEQLQDVRNRDAWNLSHYMYGDHSEKSGRVRIPLDKAMEMNLQDAQGGKTFYPAKPAPVKPYSPPPAPLPKYY